MQDVSPKPPPLEDTPQLWARAGSLMCGSWLSYPRTARGLTGAASTEGTPRRSM